LPASGQTDIVAGIPTAGELHGGLVGGHCVNFLPLRSLFAEAITFAEAARKTKQLLLDAADHQSYTFGSLVRALDMPREVNRLPLIEAQFNLERIEQNLHFEGLTVSTDANPKRFVNFDLFFNVIAEDTLLVIDCDYSTDLFDAATIRRWIGHYRTLLEARRGWTRRPCGCHLDAGGGAALHAAFAGPDDPIPELAVTVLIDLQAAATPDAVMIRFENTVTYRELIMRGSCGLAVVAAVPRETPVATTDRSAELPVICSPSSARRRLCSADPIYPPARIHAIVSGPM
jgi:non-ribosomal peptide synthetase component F